MIRAPSPYPIWHQKPVSICTNVFLRPDQDMKVGIRLIRLKKRKLFVFFKYKETPILSFT